MFDFDALSQAIVRQTVLCVGDLMLDEFVYGEVSRISPEAPAPVIAVQRSETNVGGAGNVARNIASLGAKCIFVGLVGDDVAGKTLTSQLTSEKLIEQVLIVDPDRPTTRKVRFVSEHFSTHMLRADWELASPASESIERKLIDAAIAAMPRADIILLSDYAKGVLTARVIRNIIDAARKLGKRVIVDPKSANLAIYRGATLLTPNRKEFAEATRRRIQSDADIADASIEALRTADAEAVLVTRSEQGMTLAHRLCCGGCGCCNQQAGHRNGIACRIAAEDLTACVSHGGGKNCVAQCRPRHALGRMAQAGIACRLYQRMLRHSASGACPCADAGARSVRPVGRRS